MDSDMDRVVPLDDLNDVQVAEGDPDVRGWDVLAGDGQRIGEVDELLIDTVAMRVRYLDVDLDEEVLGGPGNEDRHILIPIGYARLREEDDQVIVEELDSAQIRSIPAYSHEPLSREYESTLRSHYDRAFTGEPETDFYGHELYDQTRFYRPRGSGRVAAPDDGTRAVMDDRAR